MEPDAVLDLAITHVVQTRYPLPVLHQIVGDVLREEDVPGIAAIHYSLRHVDPGAGHIGSIVDVGDLVDRSTVNPHPKPQFGMLLIGAGELEPALHRRFRVGAENQRHFIAGRSRINFLPPPALAPVPSHAPSLSNVQAARSAR